MAKYDWKQLEKEFILSDCKSVTSFLKFKNIKISGSTKKYTKGWKNKKVQKEYEKSTKIIEKVIEKESEKEAKKIINIKDTAEKLLEKLSQATDEIDEYIIKSKTKTKKVQYDLITKKTANETIEEKENIEKQKGTINKDAIKKLTSALKDLNDIYNNSINSGSDGSLADTIQKAYEKRVNNNADANK